MRSLASSVTIPEAIFEMSIEFFRQIKSYKNTPFYPTKLCTLISDLLLSW
jgi:hypothetical protein